MKSTERPERERERTRAHAAVHTFPVTSRSHAFQLRRWKEKNGTSEWGNEQRQKKKRNPQRRGCKERGSDKAGRGGEVVNEDCIAVATRLIGFHFVFLPCRLSASLASFFSPLVSDVVLMAPPGYKATGYMHSFHTHSRRLLQHSSRNWI